MYALNPAETAIAAGVLLQRGIELGLAKVRPEGRGDDQFRIGDLPEQKIAHAHLAAGANQQVGIREPGGVKILGDGLLVRVKSRKAILNRRASVGIGGTITL